MVRDQLREESWWEIQGEISELARLHSVEVDEDICPERKHELDMDLLARANSIRALRIYTSRREGKLVGYCTWNVMYDAEAKGLLIATQGAWFVQQAQVGNGLALFKYSINELKRLGVKCVFPHHRTQGRGSPERLGNFFLRLGAIPHQIDYTLWIGDK